MAWIQNGGHEPIRNYLRFKKKEHFYYHSWIIYELTTNISKWQGMRQMSSQIVPTANCPESNTNVPNHPQNFPNDPQHKLPEEPPQMPWISCESLPWMPDLSRFTMRQWQKSKKMCDHQLATPGQSGRPAWQVPLRCPRLMEWTLLPLRILISVYILSILQLLGMSNDYEKHLLLLKSCTFSAWSFHFFNTSMIYLW